MRISYSTLETYRTCPLKYKFKEIDKLKEPKSKEAVFGTVIHATLNEIYNRTPHTLTLEEALDFFSRNWNSDLYDVEAEERAAFGMGVQMIQSYYEHNNPQEATIVGLEQHFSITIGPAGAEHTVSGIVDRIDKTKDGYEIIDYKTGKKLPSQDDVDHNLQLSIYLLAFLKRYPKERTNLKNITVSLYFLKHGVKLSSTRTEEQLAVVEEEFLAVIDEIAQSNFEPQVSPLCGWCAFQKHCPMWQHQFKEELTVSDEAAQKAIARYIEIKNNAATERKELAALQEEILRYMEQEELERVFSDAGIIAKTRRSTYDYDAATIKRILEPKGLWDDAIKVNGTALNSITKALPADERKELQAAKKEKTSSEGLSVKKA